MSISEVTLDPETKAQNANVATNALETAVIAEQLPVGFFNHLKGVWHRRYLKIGRFALPRPPILTLNVAASLLATHSTIGLSRRTK